jgi:hypothetical protein
MLASLLVPAMSVHSTSLLCLCCTEEIFAHLERIIEERDERIEERDERIEAAMFGLKLGVQTIQQQTYFDHRIFTPSNAMKSENAIEFTRIFSCLKLAFGPDLSSVVTQLPTPTHFDSAKFLFQWSRQDAGEDDKVLEKVSYKPVCDFLQDIGLHGIDVSEGENCPSKVLYDSNIYTIRKGLNYNTELLRAMGKVPTFVERIRGRTDIAVIKEGAEFTPYVHKSHVDFVIEIKTIRGFQSDAQCFREAATQLVGLNVENLDTSPSVLLTNLAKKHYVLSLSIGDDSAHSLTFKLHIERCDSFEYAVQRCKDLGTRESFSMHFGRKPTPLPSSGSESDN